MTEHRAWIAGPNPFNLAAPPVSFLQALVAYDPDLVLFASQEEPVYRLARRVHGRVPTAYQFLRHRPDTAVFAAHRLVPVASIRHEVQWSPLILLELAERDVHRVGGALAAARQLEAHEARVEARQRQATADDAAELAGFAYESVKWRTGQTIDLGTRHPEGARSRPEPPRLRRAHRPVGSAGGFVREDTPARNEAAHAPTRGRVAS
jgi:hypothetical protein